FKLGELLLLPASIRRPRSGRPVRFLFRRIPLRSGRHGFFPGHDASGLFRATSVPAHRGVVTARPRYRGVITKHRLPPQRYSITVLNHPTLVRRNRGFPEDRLRDRHAPWRNG